MYENFIKNQETGERFLVKSDDYYIFLNLFFYSLKNDIK